MRSISSSKVTVSFIGMAQGSPVKKVMLFSFPPAWNITLKIFLMTLLSGLFFMDPRAERIDDDAKLSKA
jgi:hypothetical protein